jgi:hypothetical protein
VTIRALPGDMGAAEERDGHGRDEGLSGGFSAEHSCWYWHLEGRGDDPSLLSRRYRPHGHRDGLSRDESRAGLSTPPSGAAAALAPEARARLGVGDPTGQDRTVGLETLPDDDEPEVVQAAERGQVGADEGSVGHVEVFRMSGVGTFILERPRPSSRDRRAHPSYTFIWEEPSNQ